jgi:hypothetical protein
MGNTIIGAHFGLRWQRVRNGHSERELTGQKDDGFPANGLRGWTTFFISESRHQ